MSEFRVMSSEEVNALGLNEIVHAGQIDADNPWVDSKSAGIPRQDRDGRDIISFKQYLELSELGAPMHNLAMYMQWPGKSSVQTIVASKYLKWFGQGYRPLNYQKVMSEWLTAKGRRTVPAPSAEDEFVITEKSSESTIAERAEALIREKLQAIADQSTEVTIFRCNDKYADCKRFFDSQRGLAAHWRLDHGEVIAKKRGRPAKQPQE